MLPADHHPRSRTARLLADLERHTNSHRQGLRKLLNDQRLASAGKRPAPPRAASEHRAGPPHGREIAYVHPEEEVRVAPSFLLQLIRPLVMEFVKQYLQQFRDDLLLDVHAALRNHSCAAAPAPQERPSRRPRPSEYTFRDLEARLRPLDLEQARRLGSELGAVKRVELQPSEILAGSDSKQQRGPRKQLEVALQEAEGRSRNPYAVWGDERSTPTMSRVQPISIVENIFESYAGTAGQAGGSGRVLGRGSRSAAGSRGSSQEYNLTQESAD